MAKCQAGYRLMKEYDLLLQCHTGAAGERRHDGEVTVERSNARWCSDDFEITCDNKEKVCVAFALDCCDREAIAHVATTEGIKSQDVQDLVITAVENCFGRISVLAEPTDNGSCLGAKNTASLLRDIGMEQCRTLVRSQKEWLRLLSKHSSAIIPDKPNPRRRNRHGSNAIMVRVL